MATINAVVFSFFRSGCFSPRRNLEWAPNSIKSYDKRGTKGVFSKLVFVFCNVAYDYEGLGDLSDNIFARVNVRPRDLVECAREQEPNWKIFISIY